jgi:hypothetical protein
MESGRFWLVEMKIYLHRIATITTLLLTIFLVRIAQSQNQNSKGGKSMKITSSAFQEGGDIPSKYSRDGGNIIQVCALKERRQTRRVSF